MNKLLFLLSQNYVLEIPISQYVTLTLLNNEGRILAQFDNHCPKTDKKITSLRTKENSRNIRNRISVKNGKYEISISDAKMLQSFCDIKQVQELVETIYPEKLNLHKNKQYAKNKLLYDIQWNKRFSDEQKYLMEKVLDIVCYQNNIQLNEASFLTIADTTDRSVTPYTELHFQLAKKKINEKGKEEWQYPDLVEEQIVGFLNSQLLKQGQKMKSEIMEISRKIETEKAVLKQYLPSINHNGCMIQGQEIQPN